MLLWLSSGEGLFKHDIKNTNHVETSKNNTKTVRKKNIDKFNHFRFSDFSMVKVNINKVKKQNYKQEKIFTISRMINNFNK